MNRVDVSHSDWVTESWRQRTGSDFADWVLSCLALEKLVVGTGSATTFANQRDQLAVGDVSRLVYESGCSDKIVIETNNSSEPGVEWSGVKPKFVAIERHAGFETQGVAASVAGWNQTN